MIDTGPIVLYAQRCTYYVLSKLTIILSRESQLFSFCPLQVLCEVESETTKQVHHGDAYEKNRGDSGVQLLDYTASL
jgi:hypothetical protein